MGSEGAALGCKSQGGLRMHKVGCVGTRGTCVGRAPSHLCRVHLAAHLGGDGLGGGGGLGGLGDGGGAGGEGGGGRASGAATVKLAPARVSALVASMGWALGLHT